MSSPVIDTVASDDRPAHRIRASLLLYALLLLFAPAVHAIDSTIPGELVPPLWVSACWAVPLVLFACVRNIFNRIVGYAWILWSVVGSVNVIASYLGYGDFYLTPVASAQVIYIAFTSAFLLGVVAYEQLHRPESSRVAPMPADSIHPWVTRFLLVFPFIWLVTVYRSVGFIPVLLRVDITREIYELDYGPLYGLTLLIALSMLIALHQAGLARTPVRRWIFRGLIAFFGACSAVDSKRMTLMVFMVAMLAFMIRARGTRVLRLATVALLIAAGTGLYVGGQVIRNGVDADTLDSRESQLASVGVEYRDFVYSVDEFQPGKIPRYAWATSAVVAMLNSSLLDAAGINKKAIVETGSAYAWKRLLDIDDGVRTGIVCELYFAYGYLGLFAMFAIGCISGWVGILVARVRTVLGLVFTSIIYALLMLEIVGQTTSTTGTLTVLLYAWIAFAIVRYVAPVRSGLVRTAP